VTNVPKTTTPGPIRPGVTVLVLENDPIFLRSIAGVLRREGYDVYEAETPAEARIIVDGLRKPIALLVCDLDLNGIYGRDAANALQALRPEMRVLFMSGGDSVQFRRELERTERLYLKKPFDATQLLELIAFKLQGWKPAASQ
jgi:DNA-binding response OmpR family regulator